MFLDIYLSDGCEHCSNFKKIWKEIRKKIPSIEVEIYEGENIEESIDTATKKFPGTVFNWVPLLILSDDEGMVSVFNGKIVQKKNQFIIEREEKYRRVSSEYVRWILDNFTP
jgi:glutaredoxin